MREANGIETKVADGLFKAPCLVKRSQSDSLGTDRVQRAVLNQLLQKTKHSGSIRRENKQGIE